MKPITLAEIHSLERYDRERDGVRRRILALKERRRVPLGAHLVLLFENRDTVWYQIQEMIRIERMFRREQIAHEVKTYNALLPRRGELSATLLIQYEDPVERDRRLRDLRGLDACVRLHVGDLPGIPAVFDASQIGSERLSAVQFLRFRVGARAREAWKGEARRKRIRILVDHPAVRVDVPLDPAVARELARDLDPREGSSPRGRAASR